MALPWVNGIKYCFCKIHQVNGQYRKMLEQTEFLKGKAREFDGEHNSKQMDREAVSAVMHSEGVDEGSTAFPGAEILYPAIEQVVIDPSGVQDDILDPPVAVCHRISQQEWRQLQLVDKTLSTAIKLLEDGSKLEECQDTLLKGTPEYMGLVQEQKRLVLQEGMLYRKVEAEAGEVIYQLVVPASHRQAALKGVHEELFHPHYEISLCHARKRFYWPYMARELAVKLKRCEQCVRRGSRIQKAPMKTIETTFPLELLSVDFLTIEVKGVKQDILVIFDHFTKLGQAIMTRDQTAKSVARPLWNDFFMIFFHDDFHDGFPKHILTDQGRDFESTLIREICKLASITKCRTTPYHPAGNPVERWNRTLIGMLRSLEEERKYDWQRYLNHVVHAYNCRIHESTGYSPFYLFFGRQPRLPIDLAFGIDLDKGRGGSPSQYIKTLKESLKKAYDLARNNMECSASQNKRRYDVGAKAAELELGD